MVELRAVEGCLDSLQEADLKQFSLIVLIDQPYPIVEKFDSFCRQNNIKFVIL